MIRRKSFLGGAAPIIAAGLLFLSLGTHAKEKPWPNNLAKTPFVNELFALSNSVDDFDFSGQASPSGCSGSLVYFGQSKDEKAVMLTNAHCVGMLSVPQDTTYVNKPYSSNVRLYKDRQHSINVRTTTILYGVIHKYDMALVALNASYHELEAQGVKSRRVAANPLPVGSMVIMPSGYFRTVTQCPVLGIVPTILEDVYQNANSYKYKDCNSIHGTSGSPLIDALTGEVVGLNYTGNDDGDACTYNNPCEVDENGVITAEKGMSYGDPVHEIMTCLNDKHVFDFNAPGCLLPR